MAHFAQIDENNLVIQVLVTNNDDPKGDEGYSWLIKSLGGNWVKTSYNATIRKNFAGIGFIYDAERDAFIPPQPFRSWTLDEETCTWVAPKPKPSDGKIYVWVEALLDWVEPVE
jgi:hypothetical protein